MEAAATPASLAVRKTVQGFTGECCAFAGMQAVVGGCDLGPFGASASTSERAFCGKGFAVCDRCPSADPAVDLPAALREQAERGVCRRDYLGRAEGLPYEEASRALYDAAEYIAGASCRRPCCHAGPRR